MCFKTLALLKDEREVIASIKKLNRKLRTRFSYIFVKEETEFLGQIEREKDSSTLRVEHLSASLSLMAKGLKDDYLSKTKNPNLSLMNCLFNEFKSKYISYLVFKDIICEPINITYVSMPETYKTECFNVCGPIKTQREEEIELGINILKSIEKKLEFRKNSKFKEEKLNKFISLYYFGPMTLFSYLKNKNLSKNGKYNIFYSSYKNRGIRYFNKLEDKAFDLYSNNKKKYYKQMLSIESIRLEFEKERLKSNLKNYDFYFDLFIWRLINDVEYIFSKTLGGIEKLVELTNIYSKNNNVVNKQAIEGELISVDVDLMTTINEEKKSKESSSSKRIVKGQIEVKELNDSITNTVRKDQIIRQSEEYSKKR